MAQIVDFFDMGGQRLMIIGGGAFGVGCGGAEFVDVGFHALHQAVHGLVLVLLAQPRGILQPGLGQRATVLHALVDGAQQMLAAARQVIDRHRQGEAVDLQIVEHDKMGDVGQLLAPCGLARGVGDGLGLGPGFGVLFGLVATVTQAKPVEQAPGERGREGSCAVIPA
jgi:hypothetical protein